jgi:hypothetical protein
MLARMTLPCMHSGRNDPTCRTRRAELLILCARIGFNP